MTKFEVRNSMAHASQMQHHAVYCGPNDRLRLEILGEGCERPEDDILSQPGCEGEDV